MKGAVSRKWLDDSEIPNRELCSRIVLLMMTAL